MQNSRPKNWQPTACFIGGFLLFSCLSLVFSGMTHAIQHYDLVRETGEKFVCAYLEVDNVLMGCTGKSKDLLQAREYANARLKHDDFLKAGVIF